MQKKKRPKEVQNVKTPFTVGTRPSPSGLGKKVRQEESGKKVYFMMGNKQKEHGKDLGNMFVHDLSGEC